MRPDPLPSSDLLLAPRVADLIGAKGALVSACDRRTEHHPSALGTVCRRAPSRSRPDERCPTWNSPRPYNRGIDALGRCPMSTGARRPNTLLRDARLRLRSPSGSGRRMSRQELAEAVNAYLWERYRRRAALDGSYVGKLERGDHRWPHEVYREAFRALLKVSTDAAIGFHVSRREPTTATGRLVPTAISGAMPAGVVPLSSGEEDRGTLLPSSLLKAAAPDVERAEDRFLMAPPGRFFDGQSIEARFYPAVDDGRVLTAVPASFVDSRFLRRARRGLVVGVTDADERARGFGLDRRHARRRLTKAGPTSRLLIPPAYILDDVTVGILWAVANLDEPLLNDDGLLAEVQRHCVQYEGMPHSAVGRDLAADLTTVSQMWLGSDFCARHILRHLAELDRVPQFWTREQRGEEASTWLLFSHKYQYLQAVSDRFSAGGLSRAFCIPPDAVSASPRAERVLLMLAVALMESFGIRVNVSADPEYAAVEGFVLDRGRQAIVANWVGADGIWQVGVVTDRPHMQDYGDVTGYSGAHSVIPGKSAAERLRALADYLDLDWPWLVRRCAQLGEYGCAGFAEPRSRLLSIAGVDRACRCVAEVGATTD